MFVVALTGGIAAGKSTVAKLFANRGAYTFDADDLARKATAPGTEGFNEVVAKFGEETVKNGEIDRQLLAAKVFSNPASRLLLESIIHPIVQRMAKEEIASSDAEIVIYSIPLLVETGAASNFDAIITVEASEADRIERLVNDRGYSLEEAELRIAAQASDKERIAVADWVIENSSGLEDLEQQVDQIWSAILERAR